MGLQGTPKPSWLTFDCYGTLIQWDEGLIAAVRSILAEQPKTSVEPAEFIAVFDRHEHAPSKSRSSNPSSTWRRKR